jgi:hypothetical protein
MLRVTVNGETHDCTDNWTSREAVRSVGIEVPTFCQSFLTMSRARNATATLGRPHTR